MQLMLHFVFFNLACTASADCDICKDSFSCLASLETIEVNFVESFRACVCRNRALLEECSKLQCGKQIENQILSSFDGDSVCDSIVPTSTLALIDLLRFSKENQIKSARIASQFRTLVFVLLLVVLVLYMTRAILLHMQYCEGLFANLRQEEVLPLYFPKLPRYEDIDFEE